MFREACKKAGYYTIPVVVISLDGKGNVKTSVSAAIIINDEGWFVTAAHVPLQFIELRKMATEVDAYFNSIADIDADNGISINAKRKAKRKLGKVNDDAVRRVSVLWGSQGALDIVDGVFDTGIDLAAGRLEHFNKDLCLEYPTFRPDQSDRSVGVSICRYGFPFQLPIQMGWDEDNNRFTGAENIFPVPSFVNEGIVSRYNKIAVEDEQKPTRL